MKKLPSILACLILAAGTPVSAQTEDAYKDTDSTGTSKKGLLDPSRFSIHQSVSFGASTFSGSSLKSQSLYTTMLEYRFSKPVTLNLNFGMPIHSTYSSAMNLTQENVQSLDYFKNMPLDFSLTWKPRDNLMMRFSVAKSPDQLYYLYRPMVPFEDDRIFNGW